MAGVGHENVGHTGQGLWHHKGWQLPAYIQHVANDLIASGHGESRAIEMAVGIVKNWAAGHDGHGHHIHPDTQAKAAAAVAEWEAMKAAASKSKRSDMAVSEHVRAKYSAEEMRQMAAKGHAMKDGDHVSYPISDAEDLANAIHAVGRGGADHDKIRAHIIRRAKAMGMSSKIPDNWNSDGSLKSDSGTATRAVSAPYVRSFPLEDISVRAGGDGRTVDAYAAVFNAPAPVRDPDGEYEEVIDPAAFNRVIEHRSRSKSGWGIPVLFNHGMTIFGTPSERYSVPIGVPEEIRADARGLFTRTRYHKTAAADEVLEAIREGSITSYSFRGEFPRSDPRVPRGGFRRDHAGQLRSVRRVESTLMEYGPATFPVYEGADVVSVRAEQAALLLGSLSPGERERLATILTPGTPYADPPELGTPSDEGPAADDPPFFGHSTRSPREELQHQRAQFLIRHGGGNG